MTQIAPNGLGVTWALAARRLGLSLRSTTDAWAKLNAQLNEDDRLSDLYFAGRLHFIDRPGVRLEITGPGLRHRAMLRAYSPAMPGDPRTMPYTCAQLVRASDLRSPTVLDLIARQLRIDWRRLEDREGHEIGDTPEPRCPRCRGSETIRVTGRPAKFRGVVQLTTDAPCPFCHPEAWDGDHLIQEPA